VPSDEEATEDLVLDSLPVPPQRLKVPVRVPLGDALRVSAPTMAVARKWTRHAAVLEGLR
jgi:hypothetical protein